jgi:hypothetical protein
MTIPTRRPDTRQPDEARMPAVWEPFGPLP